MFIINWFTSLSLAGQIFTCIAVPATLVLLVQTVMMFIGAGFSQAEVGEDLPDEIPDEIPDDVPEDLPDGIFGENAVGDVVDSAGFESLKIFTVRGMIAFFVMFGWVGVAMDGANLALTIVVAALSGAGAMLILSVLYRFAMKLRTDGNINNKNAIGVSGRVQLIIPAERAGEGKVHLMLQGAYVERDAVTDDKEPIPTGSEVVVIGVSGHTTLVVRRK